MQIRHRSRSISLLLIVAATTASAAQGAEPSYPTRPIRMLVGFTPAGPTDLTARMAAQHLTETLGQQVIVDNRPRGGGTLASITLARAEPDGYTISLGSGGELAIGPNPRTNSPYAP